MLARIVAVIQPTPKTGLMYWLIAGNGRLPVESVT